MNPIDSALFHAELAHAAMLIVETILALGFLLIFGRSIWRCLCIAFAFIAYTLGFID